MRRVQNQSNQYSTRVPVNSTYYYDDADDYLGDYSESDVVSEEPIMQPMPSMQTAMPPMQTMPPMQPMSPMQTMPSPHVTEIYRRSPTIDRYNQNVYQPPNYYCKNLPQVVPQQMRRPAVPSLYKQHPMQMMDESTRYYSMGALGDGYRQQYAPPYNPQVANVRRAANSTATRIVTRRHPVTVPTPKYYRRVPNNLYKKPSTLCLPVASQKDPAVYHYRRFKKTLEEPQSIPPLTPLKIQSSSPISNNLVASSPVVRTPESPIVAENNETDRSDVSAILARYEKILNNSLNKKMETNSSKSSVRTKKSKKRKLLQMKPKVPPSIKEKQEKTQMSREEKNAERYDEEENLEVEEMTTEVLDSMLTELINSGCENKLNLTNEKQNVKEKFQCNQNNNGPKGDSCSKSFNYSDIVNSISRTQDSYAARNDGSQLQNIFKACQQTNSSRISVESAMELHRSKSYIVNLIDRALSKELGTCVEEISLKEVQNSNPCQGSGCHNKCADKSDKGFCLEITDALAETILSNSATAHNCQPKQSTACACNGGNGEPSYVKQLRQLRWGHLKHIQTEVRRLEDLERFLDACSGDS